LAHELKEKSHQGWEVSRQSGALQLAGEVQAGLRGLDEVRQNFKKVIRDTPPLHFGLRNEQQTTQTLQEGGFTTSVLGDDFANIDRKVGRQCSWQSERKPGGEEFHHRFVSAEH
jgi:hypothetical protein